MSVVSGAPQAGRGRPLRFLALVVTSWVGVRIVLLWPALDLAEAVPALLPVPLATAASAPPALPSGRVSNRPSPLWRVAKADPLAPLALIRHLSVRPSPLALSPSERVRKSDSMPDSAPLLPGLPHSSPRPTPGRSPSPWSASAWLVARGGAGLAPGGLGGQLGGSQAGVRLAYALDRRHRIALAGRVTTPLGGGLREAALGVEWQPTRLPVRLIAEHRFALGEGRGGPALGVVGGFGPVAVPLGFRLEGYGQAGAIRRTRTELYADGALRAAHTVTMLGATRLDLGAGMWGGAQRGAERLDVGPSLGLSVPIAKQTVRLSLDWRERIAGKAHPGSGPAVTLGADF